MFSKIKMWAGGLLAGLVGLFYILAQTRKAQRDKARSQRDTARRNTETQKAVHEASEKIHTRLNEKRKQNAEVTRNEESKPKAERRSGNFGTTLDRMRDN